MFIKSLAVVAMVPMLALGAPTTSVAAPLSTTVAGTPSSSAASPTTTIVDPGPADNFSCNYLYGKCSEIENYVDFRTMFNKSACVATLICYNQQSSIDDTISVMWQGRRPWTTGWPTSKELPRLSINIFNQNSSDGKVWTQQNFIDFYYGQLSTVGVYPKSVDVVIAYWSRIAAWTGFCQTKAIPYQNLADWFTYSSTVHGTVTSC